MGYPVRPEVKRRFKCTGCSSILLNTRSEDQADAVDGFQNDLAGCNGPHFSRFVHGEAESADQSGQHNFELEKAVLLTYAVAQSGAERNEGEWMSSGAVLRKEAFRFEGLRIRVHCRAVVHSVDQHAHG